jgi:hypothetical protein
MIILTLIEIQHHRMGIPSFFLRMPSAFGSISSMDRAVVDILKKNDR